MTTLRFIAASFFFLLAKFYAYWCRQRAKVGLF